MRHSARFLANLRGDASPRWVTEASWSSDGGKAWYPLALETGTVTASSKSQCRWETSLTCRDVITDLGQINPFQTQVKIRQGMVFSDYEEPEWEPLGVYAVNRTQRSTRDRSRTTITAKSFESYLIRSSLTQARTLRPQAAKVAAEALIREVLPSALIIWDDSLAIDLRIPTVTITDRWATIDGSTEAKSIAQSLGARCYHDERGFWRFVPVASLSDDPTWTAYEGPGGVQISAEDEQTSEGTYNVEVVYGTPAGGGVLGPFIAKDTNPDSATYVGRLPEQGGYGEVPAPEYRTPFVTNNAQGRQVALSRLNAHRGLRRQLGGEFRHDPTKRPDQVGIIDGIDGPLRCILDSVTFDLSPAPQNLTCEVRMQQQTYDAGSIIDVDGLETS